MRRLPVLGILLVLCACELDREANVSIAAANALTLRYAKQQLRANVAGTDCLVLLIQARFALDDATVEAIHYGTGEQGIHDGGIRQFADDRKFRAVAYKDSNGGLWTYGAITRNEAQAMPVCR